MDKAALKEQNVNGSVSKETEIVNNKDIVVDDVASGCSLTSGLFDGLLLPTVTFESEVETESEGDQQTQQRPYKPRPSLLVAFDPLHSSGSTITTLTTSNEEELREIFLTSEDSVKAQFEKSN